MRIHTIGHSTRSPDEFAALLEVHGVRELVDIRTVPRSRHVPWATREELPSILASRGIGYRHIAALGGLRKPLPDSKNDAWRNTGFRGYADHMQTAEFARGVDELLDVAREVPAAVMCAEAVPWRCHRSLLADALLARGVEVLHILDSGVKPATMTPFAKVRGERVSYPAAGGRTQTRLPGA